LEESILKLRIFRSWSGISDFELEIITEQMENLKQLYLTPTRALTFEGLNYLHRLKKLEILGLPPEMRELVVAARIFSHKVVVVDIKMWMVATDEHLFAS